MIRQNRDISLEYQVYVVFVYTLVGSKAEQTSQFAVA